MDWKYPLVFLQLKIMEDISSLVKGLFVDLNFLDLLIKNNSSLTSKKE